MKTRTILLVCASLLLLSIGWHFFEGHHEHPAMMGEIGEAVFHAAQGAQLPLLLMVGAIVSALFKRAPKYRDKSGDPHRGLDPILRSLAAGVLHPKLFGPMVPFGSFV